MKTEGCNRMRCLNCKKSMCYVCRQPVQHYEHFYNTENGGRPEPGKCPLYINEEELHAQEVQKAAKEARKNLDPNVNLKYDPTQEVLGGDQENHPDQNNENVENNPDKAEMCSLM